jgi:hypothetical protein
MKESKLILGLVLLLAVAGPFSHTAEARGNDKMRAMVGQQFIDALPDIGQPLPALQLHDDKGNLVQLGDVDKGKYRVFVLGCLT